MKVYTVDRWRDYGVDKDLVLCSTIELAEKEIVRLKEEDEQAFKKAENLPRSSRIFIALSDLEGLYWT